MSKDRGLPGLAPAVKSRVLPVVVVTESAEKTGCRRWWTLYCRNHRQLLTVPVPFENVPALEKSPVNPNVSRATVDSATGIDLCTESVLRTLADDTSSVPLTAKSAQPKSTAASPNDQVDPAPALPAQPQSR